jgi:hypothetical protein
MFLTGAGHFGFGFLVGTMIFVLLICAFKRNYFLQVYSPFLPFILGLIAILPYSLLYKEQCELPVLLNVFVFYSWVHCHSLVVSFLAHLHLVVLICALIYGFIILRYIFLVRKVRRFGW